MPIPKLDYVVVDKKIVEPGSDLRCDCCNQFIDDMEDGYAWFPVEAVELQQPIPVEGGTPDNPSIYELQFCKLGCAADYFKETKELRLPR